MASVWQNNKLLRKWEQKNFKYLANGDFNYNLAHPLEDPLVIALSEYLKVKKEYIYVGAGSSQFIGAITGLKCWDRVFLSDIEFALYKRTANLAGKKIININGITTADFINNLKKLKSKEKDLLCISSPRWFSGEAFSKKQIKEILEIFNGTLIIDEAYVDYSNDENGMLDICMKNDRVILFRSFSKKFLASGYRTGYMITKKEI
jgi:histidinol-phosphate aminotransferase